MGPVVDFDVQYFAAQGYSVITPNPRGSSGRGEAYSSAIYADWGNRDAKDDLASVDDAVARGLADPARLCVEGWSYGGMSTNYIIAQDTRFKCAMSGASMSNILAGYGTDEYVRDYETELGVPWKNTAAWMKISFPYLHADRIKTPVLFIGRHQGLQRAAAQCRADVPVGEKPRDRDPAHRLSRPVSRPHATERPEGPPGARHGVDRKASEIESNLPLVGSRKTRSGFRVGVPAVKLSHEKRIRSRSLRATATDHERELWSRLRALNRLGYHFRRQAPFQSYFLDFVEHGAKLVIELDGRSAWL